MKMKMKQNDRTKKKFSKMGKHFLQSRLAPLQSCAKESAQEIQQFLTETARMLDCSYTFPKIMGVNAGIPGFETNASEQKGIIIAEIPDNDHTNTLLFTPEGLFECEQYQKYPLWHTKKEAHYGYYVLYADTILTKLTEISVV